VPTSLTFDVAEAKWQLSSQPNASTLIFALPAPKRPLSPDTVTVHGVDGAVHGTAVEMYPLMDTRFANS
jgi:hypothetical protein